MKPDTEAIVRKLNALAVILTAGGGISNKVPYTGATTTVNLGSQQFKTQGAVNIGVAVDNPSSLGQVRIGQGTSVTDIGAISAAANGIWFNQATPSTSNYSIFGDTNNTRINAPNGTLFLRVGNAQRLTIDTNTSSHATPFMIGSLAVPTALLNLAAGTATASTAPLKFTSGTNLTTAEAGAMEYNGTNLFFTRAGTVREGVITQSAVTTEAVVSDTTVTVNIGGVTYKLLARA